MEEDQGQESNQYSSSDFCGKSQRIELLFLSHLLTKNFFFFPPVYGQKKPSTIRFRTPRIQSHHCRICSYCCSAAVKGSRKKIRTIMLKLLLPGGRSRGRPPWSAPSGRTTRRRQRPAGSSAPQRRSAPSSPWRRTGVWARPAGLRHTHREDINTLIHSPTLKTKRPQQQDDGRIPFRVKIKLMSHFNSLPEKNESYRRSKERYVHLRRSRRRSREREEGEKRSG